MDSTANKSASSIINQAELNKKFFQLIAADAFIKDVKLTPNISEISALISQGADVNVVTKLGYFKGKTLLSLAASNGESAIVKLLLTTPGILVNQAEMSLNGPGSTPLMLAIQSGDKATISALLSFPGVDVNQITKDGETALMVAVGRNDLQTVNDLLAFPDIDVNQGGFYNDTALIRAVDNKKSINIIRALLAAPRIDVNKTNRSGATPLIAAASNGYIDAVAALLSARNVNISLTYRNGKTGLTRAAEMGHDEIVSLIENHIIMQGSKQIVNDLPKRPEPVVFSCKNVCAKVKRARNGAVSQAKEATIDAPARRNPKRATAFTGSYKI